MQLKPLSDRVVVQAVEQEEKTQSGIFLPDTAKEKPQYGNVIAVGPGRLSQKGDKVPMSVRQGDKVLFAKYGGTEVKLNGSDYLIMSENDILGIVEE